MTDTVVNVHADTAVTSDHSSDDSTATAHLSINGHSVPGTGGNGSQTQLDGTDVVVVIAFAVMFFAVICFFLRKSGQDIADEYRRRE